MKYRFYAELLQNRSPFAVIAQIIQLTIHRRYNHIEFMAVPESTDHDILYFGAVSPRSRQTTLTEIRKRYRVIDRIELKRQAGFEHVTDLDILKIAHKRLGIKYGYNQNIVLFLMACVSWLKKKLSRAVIDDEKEQNCTEMFARIASEGFGYRFKTSFDMTEFEDIIKIIRG